MADEKKKSSFGDAPVSSFGDLPAGTSFDSQYDKQNVRFPILGATSDPQFAGTQAGTKTQGVGTDSLLNRQSVPTKDSGDIMKELAGRASNALGMGISGAQMGAPGGLAGMLAGGAGGGIAGALLPPSATPGTDMGATAGDLAASVLFRGGLNTGRKLARAAGLIGGTGLGALFGSQGDKAMGFQKETPFDKIGIYSGLSTIGAIGSAMSSDASPLQQAADRMKQQTGVNYPLSTSESLGRFGGLEKMFTEGSSASRSLGVAQDAAAQKALEKIIGAPMSDSIGTILEGTKMKDTLRNQVIKPWLKTWQDANPVLTSKEVPTGVLDASGNPLTKTVTTSSKNVHPDWGAFDARYGLTKDERDGIFRIIHAAPDQVINGLMPTRENQVQGLFKLRGFIKALDNSGNDVEAGQVGTAFAMRYLRGPMENGQAASGVELARRIENAIGTAENPGHLLVALGPERADALKTVAEVVKNANPLEKVASDGISAQKRAGGYTFNKAIFRLAEAGALAGTGAGGMAGHGDVGTIFLGTVGGAVIGMTIPTLIGAAMMQPKLGKIILAASKGDAAATARIVRTLTSSAMSASDRKEEETSTIKSRLEGMFKK